MQATAQRAAECPSPACCRARLTSPAGGATVQPKGRATVTGAKDDRLKGSIKGDVARRERLAQELRENLKRRKAKARAQAEATAQSADNGDPPAR